MLDSAGRSASLSLAERAVLERRLVSDRAARAKAQRIPRRGEAGPLPLSFAQQRLWFLEQWAPESAAYHIPLALRARGALDVGALQRALDGVVSRHEALRTTFRSAEDGPVQVVQAGAPVPLRLFDLRHVPDEQRGAELQRLFLEESCRPFDLTRDLMLRAAVARLAEDEHGLLIVFHHIAADGWSMAPFVRELTALYEGFAAGRAPRLPDLPLQYGDFALWQRGWLQGERLERQLHYWRRQLEGAATLELPLDHPRPPVQGYRGASQSLEFPPELLESLKALSRDEEVTPFMTLLAAFQTLLYRYTGQEDISVGSPVAGRGRVELEPLIGFFVNTLVLRTDLSGRPTFRQLLRRVRQVALEAFDHQDVPFEKLVEELAPERDTSRSPLFQVLFVLQNTPRESLQFAGVNLTRLPVDYRAAKFDLQMTLGESGGRLKASLVYNPDLFEESTVGRMLGHYRALLEAAVADPDGPVGALPLLPPDELERVVTGWNDTHSSYPQEARVQELVEAQVRRTPDAVAVAFGEERLTYRELNRRANQLAHFLRGRGVGPGALVGLCVRRSPAMIVGVLGILKAGAAYVPLDPDYPRDRLAVMLEDARVAVLLTQRGLCDHLPAAGAPTVLLDADWGRIAQGSPEDPEARGTPDHLAYVIYTSGSTGRPKGVTMPHRPLVNLLSWQLRSWVRPGPATTLQFASINFDVSFQEIFSTLGSGGTLLVLDEEVRRDPAALAQLLAEKDVGRAYLPPVVLQHLAEAVAGSGRPPRALREIITAGEQLQITRPVAELLARLEGLALQNHYGPTEAHVVTCHTLEGEPASWPALPPIGRPIFNTQIYLLDAYGRPVPQGVPGELHIGGVCLARGYLNRPELTAEKFVPDPFSAVPGARLYKTGDLARHTADGAIEYLGRIDHQVKLRGFRIELGEIEAVLSQHPGVREAVVVVREDAPGDKRLVAYVATDAADGVTAGGLRDFVKEKLPAYMVPAAVVCVGSLPLTPNGKVDRRALPAPGAPAPSDEQTQAPRDGLEMQLALLWEEVLGRKAVGIRDNFFDLGGHSLLAAQLFAKMEKVLGRKLPLRALFEAPTVEGLAALIRQGANSHAWPTLVPVRPGGKGRPLFGVAKPNVNALGYAFLARHLKPEHPVYVLQSPYRAEQVAYSREEFRALAREYLRHLRAMQPEGPYMLTGYCEGALIAFEMAHQLEAEGQRVALLAVLDAWPVENTRSYWRWRLNVGWRRIRPFLQTGLRAKAGMVLNWLRGRSRRPAAPDEAPPSLTSYQSFVRRYWPGKDFVQPTITGKIRVFRAQEQPFWRVRDHSLGWSRWATEGAEVQVTPGEHRMLLREPNVQVLAAKLNECIAALGL